MKERIREAEGMSDWFLDDLEGIDADDIRAIEDAREHEKDLTSAVKKGISWLYFLLGTIVIAIGLIAIKTFVIQEQST